MADPGRPIERWLENFSAALGRSDIPAIPKLFHQDSEIQAMLGAALQHARPSAFRLASRESG